jgi:hypothetical protein
VLEYCAKSELHPRSGLGMLKGTTEEVCFALDFLRLPRKVSFATKRSVVYRLNLLSNANNIGPLSVT